MRTCSECPKSLEGMHGLAKVCSFECGETRRKRLHRERLRADPEYREHNRRIRREAFARSLADPEKREEYAAKRRAARAADRAKQRAYWADYRKRRELAGGPLTGTDMDRRPILGRKTSKKSDPTG